MDFSQLLDYIVPLIFLIIWGIIKAVSSQSTSSDSDLPLPEEPLELPKTHARKREKTAHLITQAEREHNRKLEEEMKLVDRMKAKDKKTRKKGKIEFDAFSWEHSPLASSLVPDKKPTMTTSLNILEDAQKGIILKEILDTPLSLRDRPNSGRYW